VFFNIGIYLNNTSAYSLYREDYLLTYFVDKTDILNNLVPLLESKSKSSDASGKTPKYICITRPRRFGKSVMANMIAAYFGKGTDSSEVFDQLNVSEYPWYREHLNKHNVIHIVFNEIPELCNSYEEYITRISKILIRDLRNAYPQAEIEKGDTVWDALSSVYAYCGGEKFIFVLDEWDFIFHQSFATDADKTAFARFLNALLKDKAYVEMAYITGVLPIAKFSSGSALNMFFEFTMVSMEQFSEYFGFTDEEVDVLYNKSTIHNLRVRARSTKNK